MTALRLALHPLPLLTFASLHKLLSTEVQQVNLRVNENSNGRNSFAYTGTFNTVIKDHVLAILIFRLLKYRRHVSFYNRLLIRYSSQFGFFPA